MESKPCGLTNICKIAKIQICRCYSLNLNFTLLNKSYCGQKIRYVYSICTFKSANFFHICWRYRKFDNAALEPLKPAPLPEVRSLSKQDTLIADNSIEIASRRFETASKRFVRSRQLFIWHSLARDRKNSLILRCNPD